MTPPKPKETLRDRGYTSCEHPGYIVNGLSGAHRCRFCGAERSIYDREWRGGSIDFRAWPGEFECNELKENSE